MASYFNLILDTLAPSGITLAINDGEIVVKKSIDPIISETVKIIDINKK